MKFRKDRLTAVTKHSFFLSGQLGKLLDRWHLPPELVLMSTALVVGVVTGVSALLFRYMIDGVAWVGYVWLPQWTVAKSYVVIAPVVGGLLVGLLIHFGANEAKGSGIPEVMEAVALRRGRIRPRVALIKSLASSLTIGSGGSAGREGPIVQIGSAIGSTIGQMLDLSDERISNLVACGAAAGIAVTFNAPIAGVLFALEVILGRFTVRHFSTVVIAAVTASVIGRATFGDSPAFEIPLEYGVQSLWEYLFYPLLGVLAAFVGVFFTRLLYWSQTQFERLVLVPAWARPAIGGALLALFALTYPMFGDSLAWEEIPQVFNVGYELIEQALASRLVLNTAVFFLVAKIVATCLTLGSGGSGGVFAPSLFIGAMLGTAFELLLSRLFPGLSSFSGAYALVGMAAMVAATAHAPITAVIMLFELTGDYRIILPIMLTVVIATLIAQQLLQGESIYTLKLRRRGIRLQRGRDLDILQGVMIDEVMTREVKTVSVDTSLDELADIFLHSHHHGLMVLDAEEKLWGVVTLADLEQALTEEKPKDTPTSEIGTTWPHLKVAYPDETMGDALARMGARGLGRLPVVSRKDPYQLLGLIWRADITKAYSLALVRRTEIQQRTTQVHHQYEEDTEFVEIPLAAKDKVVGKTVAMVAAKMPKDCVLVSIKRNGRVIIPHGDTVFEAGDEVTAFTRHQDANQLFHCLHGRAGGNFL